MTDVTGVVGVPAGLIGVLLGGYIVKRFDLKVRAIIKLVIGLNAAATCLYLMFVIRCENVDFAGITVTYDGATLAR